MPCNLVTDCLHAISIIHSSSISSRSDPKNTKAGCCHANPHKNRDTWYYELLSSPFIIRRFCQNRRDILLPSNSNVSVICNDMFTPIKSGFCSLHGTEAVLLKVTNNLLLIASASNPSWHHCIFRHKQPMPLLSLLSITGTALSGLKYYLTNRQQLVALY